MVMLLLKVGLKAGCERTWASNSSNHGLTLLLRLNTKILFK